MLDTRIDPKDFGRRFREALAARKWRVRDFMRQVILQDKYVSWGTIYCWHRGQTTPNTYDRVEWIAKTLGVSPEWLLHGTGEQESDDSRSA